MSSILRTIGVIIFSFLWGALGLFMICEPKKAALYFLKGIGATTPADTFAIVFFVIVGILELLASIIFILAYVKQELKKEGKDE